MIDAATALTFSLAANPGVYALLLGSGVSRAADIPTGWEIVENLALRLAAAQDADPSDPMAWFEETYGETPSYSSLMEALAATPGERRSLLHGYIEPTPEEAERSQKTPTAAHRSIARLVRDGIVRVIVTTNFDRLLETALREEGVEPAVVSTEDGVRGMAPLIHQRCLVLKVHGDYLDTRILNTDGELSAYGSDLNNLLDRIFDDHGLIICGWSGDWDPALRAAVLRAPNRRYPLYWAARREPAGLAADLMSARDGRWVGIESADAFFATLQQGVETQRALARPHPLSVELFAGALKRGLAAGPPRVALGDLLQTEARRAMIRIDSAEVLGQRVLAETEEAEFWRRVDLFESTTEPLVRAFEILGRWGDGNETQQVRDLLYTFHRPSHQSGRVLWNELGGYPAVLLWYAYGMGAAKAGRFLQLHSWLSLPFRNAGRGGESPAVSTLFLWEFGGSREGWWGARLADPSRFAFSSYLSARLRAVLSSEFVSAADFDRSIELFELLATLRHLQGATTKASLSEPVARGGVSLPSPVGRLAKGGFREAPPLIQSLNRPEEIDRLIQADFFDGDVEWLKLALERIAAVHSDPFANF